jgi:hypothetical protein
MLGVAPASLEYAISQGVFRVEWQRRGWQRIGRILRSEQVFDPSSSSLKRKPDPVWGAAWGFLAYRVPDDLAQTLPRVPEYGVNQGYPVFRGWRWICPACRRRVRTVYYPLPVVNFPQYYGIDPARDELDRIEPPPPTFACVKCHGVRYFNRIGPNPWNELVHHLSGGLLYGYEVKRPTWVTPDRRRKFAPQLRRAPSRRRQEVLERLLKGWEYKQIARDLGIGYTCVADHVVKLYRQHNVHARAELIAKLRPAALTPRGVAGSSRSA